MKINITKTVLKFKLMHLLLIDKNKKNHNIFNQKLNFIIKLIMKCDFLIILKAFNFNLKLVQLIFNKTEFIILFALMHPYIRIQKKKKKKLNFKFHIFQYKYLS